MDSDTTTKQKQKLLSEVRVLVAYLEVHGTEGITMDDLRDAHWSLSRMEREAL